MVMRELHVTVPATERLKLIQFNLSQDKCAMRPKVHRFRNILPSGLPPVEDVMTGEGLDASATNAGLTYWLLRASVRKKQYEEGGLTVLRVKVECDAREYPEADDTGYYETHMEVIGPREDRNIPDDIQRMPVLFSQSVDTMIWYATLRSRGCSLQVHHARVGRATRLLLEHKIQVVARPRHEYVELDTNRAHDAAWEGKRYGFAEAVS